MDGRVVDIAPARSVRRATVVVACAAAVAIGFGVSRLFAPAPSSPPAAPMVAPSVLPSVSGTAVVSPVAATATVTTVAVTCPLQSMSLSSDGTAARTICMDATLVRQTGSVRSYVVNAGDAEGWALRIDMVERRLLSASLQARDGRSYACEAASCRGEALLIQANAAQRLSLRGLRISKQSLPGNALSAPAASRDEMTLSADFRVPSDEQVPGLACAGPSLSIASSNGANRTFCGQGGAGVEIADNGRLNYRFQDFEGQTLMVAIDAEQRVIGIELEPFACQGAACTGASTASAAPDNPLAERSFYFGRTALFDAGSNANGRPALVLNGTLVMPNQQ